MGTTSEERCLAMGGCCYTEADDHCSMCGISFFGICLGMLSFQFKKATWGFGFCRLRIVTGVVLKDGENFCPKLKFFSLILLSFLSQNYFLNRLSHIYFPRARLHKSFSDDLMYFAFI